MDRLDAMSVLVVAAEAGSFSGASRRLGVPLSTISRKVADLERHIGTRLLIRTTRKLTPTDAGAVYIDACKGILEQVAEAERTASGEYNAPRGDLVITAPLVFGRLHVLPVVNQFLTQFPEVNVRLVLSDRNVDLVDDHVDVAVRIGTLPDSSLIATRLGVTTRVVCGSPTFLAAHGIPQTPSDLAEMPCITFDSIGGAPTWLFATADRKSAEAADVRSRLHVNTAEAALDAAIAGIGLTQVLSYQAASAAAERRLELVLRAFEREPIPVNLIHPGQGRLPLKLRTFIEFAVPRIRSVLAGTLHASPSRRARGRLSAAGQ